MKITVLIFLIILFTAGCKNKNHVPAGVLPQQKMQAVLWDMMRADQFLNEYVLNKDSSLNKTTESLKYYQQVFALHKITRDEFYQSFLFYTSHPAVFKPVMDSIAVAADNKSARLTRPDTTRKLPLDTAVILPGKILRDTTNSGKRKTRRVIESIPSSL